MIYKIGRISLQLSKKKPCTEAKKRKRMLKKVFEDDPPEYVTEWVIEINTLEELQNFIKKYGSIIMRENEILIYDDYID